MSFSLPCALVSRINNPSFERDGGSLDGWDVFINPPLSQNTFVSVATDQFYEDSYGGSALVSGHSAKITVAAGEVIELFNVIEPLCPGGSISSSIQFWSATAPTCDIYFGMV
jgi:hypothetical protein